MNDFSFGKGRRLFTHIKRHRPDIEGQNDFDCLEADGFVEHNIDLQISIFSIIMKKVA